MANLKITQLPSGTPSPTDVVPFVDLNDNTTKKALVSDFSSAQLPDYQAPDDTQIILTSGNGTTGNPSADIIIQTGIPDAGENGGNINIMTPDGITGNRSGSIFLETGLGDDTEKAGNISLSTNPNGVNSINSAGIFLSVYGSSIGNAGVVYFRHGRSDTDDYAKDGRVIISSAGYADESGYTYNQGFSHKSTTDNTPTEVKNAAIQVSTSPPTFIEFYYVSSKISDSTNNCAFIRRALVKNPTGTSAILIGSVEDVYTNKSENTNLDVDIIVNGIYAVPTITGDMGIDLDWQIYAKTFNFGL